MAGSILKLTQHSKCTLKLILCVYLGQGWDLNSCGRMHAKSLPSCPTLCDTMDCSVPGSFIHGVFQTRILEWVAMPSSRGSSQSSDRTCISCLLHSQVDSLASPEKTLNSYNDLLLLPLFFWPFDKYLSVLMCQAQP